MNPPSHVSSEGWCCRGGLCHCRIGHDGCSACFEVVLAAVVVGGNPPSRVSSEGGDGVGALDTMGVRHDEPPGHVENGV